MPVGKTKNTHVRAEKPLKEYAGKRDFARTPEPAGSAIRGHALARQLGDVFPVGEIIAKNSVNLSVRPKRS